MVVAIMAEYEMAGALARIKNKTLSTSLAGRHGGDAPMRLSARSGRAGGQQCSPP